jgi:hypothetical protein
MQPTQDSKPSRSNSFSLASHDSPPKKSLKRSKTAMDEQLFDSVRSNHKRHKSMKTYGSRTSPTVSKTSSARDIFNDMVTYASGAGKAMAMDEDQYLKRNDDKPNDLPAFEGGSSGSQSPDGRYETAQDHDAVTILKGTSRASLGKQYNKRSNTFIETTGSKRITTDSPKRSRSVNVREDIEFNTSQTDVWETQSKFEAAEEGESQDQDQHTKGQSDPKDAAITELVAMGFPVERAKVALNGSDTGVDISAAIAWLLDKSQTQPELPRSILPVSDTKRESSTRSECKAKRSKTNVDITNPANTSARRTKRSKSVIEEAGDFDFNSSQTDVWEPTSKAAVADIHESATASRSTRRGGDDGLVEGLKRKKKTRTLKDGESKAAIEQLEFVPVLPPGKEGDILEEFVSNAGPSILVDLNIPTALSASQKDEYESISVDETSQTQPVSTDLGLEAHDWTPIEREQSTLDTVSCNKNLTISSESMQATQIISSSPPPTLVSSSNRMPVQSPEDTRKALAAIKNGAMGPPNPRIKTKKGKGRKAKQRSKTIMGTGFEAQDTESDDDFIETPQAKTKTSRKPVSTVSIVSTQASDNSLATPAASLEKSVEETSTKSTIAVGFDPAELSEDEINANVAVDDEAQMEDSPACELPSIFLSGTAEVNKMSSAIAGKIASPVLHRSPITPRPEIAVFEIETPTSKARNGQHSPITGGKVPYRVGLSKRCRIAPLLRIVRK